MDGHPAWRGTVYPLLCSPLCVNDLSRWNGCQLTLCSTEVDTPCSTLRDLVDECPKTKTKTDRGGKHRIVQSVKYRQGVSVLAVPAQEVVVVFLPEQRTLRGTCLFAKLSFLPSQYPARRQLENTATQNAPGTGIYCLMHIQTP